MTGPAEEPNEDQGRGEDPDPETAEWDRLHDTVRELALARLSECDHLPLDRLAGQVSGSVDQADFSLLETGDWDEGDWEDVLDQALLETDETWMTDDDEVWLLDRLLDGLVVTHRLTESEKENHLLHLVPDLLGLFWDTDDGMALAETGRLRILFPHEGVAGTDENGSVAGPPGWLDDLSAGTTVAIRRSGGSVQVSAMDSVPAPAGDPRSGLISEAYDRLSEEELGVEAEELVMEAIAADRASWLAPRAPLTDLLDAAGFERRGAWVGRAGRRWEAPFQARRREWRDHLSALYDLDHCCLEALDVVESAWHDFRLAELAQKQGRASESPELDRRELARALGHGNVGPAFYDDFTAGSPEQLAALGRFCARLAGLSGALAAPPLLLLALVAEQEGRVLDAEAHLHQAVLEDGEYEPALEELSWYVADRGDADRAAALLRRAGAPDDHPGRRFLEGVAQPRQPAGRNDPCPCGSGRKFKACCQRRPRLDEPQRVSVLVHKLVAYATRPSRRPRLYELVEVAEPASAAAHQRLLGVLLDVVIFEGGLLVEFLAHRGPLLPLEELEMARTWLGTPLRLLEVTATEPGPGLALRDTRTGDPVSVTERTGSSGIALGDYVLARVVPGAASHYIVGLPMQLELRHRASVMALLDLGPNEYDLAAWLGAALSPPSMSNTEGEDIVLCRAVLRPMTSSRADVEQHLDQAFQRHSTRSWADITEVGGKSVIRGSLSWEEEGLVYVTNSEPRLERMIAELTSLVPDLTVADESRVALDEAMRNRGESGPDLGVDEESSPVSEAEMDEIVQQMERAWLDESIPALGGITPRQAADDPTRREDLERLLREAEADQAALEERGPGTGRGFDASRLRRLLGL